MSSEKPRNQRRPYILVSLLGMLLLSYVAGAYAGVFKVFPYPQLLQPSLASLASTDEMGVEEYGKSAAPAPWHPVWYRTFGTLKHASSQVSPGYTLYSSAHRAEAMLIDSRGRERHRWSLSFEEAWPSPSHVRPSAGSESPYWRRVHVFDDGSLLAVYTAPQHTPQGFGMVKLDARSRILWKYSERTHHDFALHSTGEISLLTHRLRDISADPIAAMPQLPETVLADELVRLSPAGKERERLPLLEAFANSPYLDVLRMYPTNVDSPGEQPWDVLHTCSVAVVGADFADEHPFAEPGQLLLAFRTPDLIALLDTERRQIVWATRGAWWQPTDADPLPDGDILVYDSNGHGADGLASRILKFDPATEKVTWSYTGTEDQPFWSQEGGTQQWLSNGNILVTSPLNGQIKEIGADGRPVWEYRNPVYRTRDGQTHISVLWDAQRIRPNELDFLGDSNDSTPAEH